MYPTIISERHYYYKNKKIVFDYESGSFLLIAPGDIVWKSDLDILEQISKRAETFRIVGAGCREISVKQRI
jgi:hypothetical protein